MHDAVRKMLLQVYVLPGPTRPDHDLWAVLYREAQHAMTLGLFSNVVKVRSHEDALQYTCHVEQWAIEGNDAADRCAETAWPHLPLGVRDSWANLVADHRLRKKMIAQIHRLIVAIGLRVVAHKKELLQKAEKEWEAAADTPRPHRGEPVSLGDIQPWESLSAKHTLRVIAKSLNAWMLSLSDGEDVAVHWVSSAHLLVHYQMTTEDPGVCFDQRTKFWAFASDHIEEHGFCFQQSANWLQAAIRCYCRALNMVYDCQIRMPDGCIFRCWTPCLRLRISSAAFWRCDRALKDNGVVAVKSPKKDFKYLRHPSAFRAVSMMNPLDLRTLFHPVCGLLAGGKWKMASNHQPESHVVLSAHPPISDCFVAHQFASACHISPRLVAVRDDAAASSL